MDKKVPETGLVSWPRKPDSSNLSLSEALEAVAAMVDAIPGGRVQVTPEYLRIIAETLREFPREVALECAHPIRGLTRKTPYLPRVPEIIAWCSARIEDAMRGAAKERAREEQFADRVPLRKLAVGGSHRCPLFVTQSSSRYQDMVDRARTADASQYEFGKGVSTDERGIWVPVHWYQSATQSNWGAPRFTIADLESLYRRQSGEE